MSGQFGIWLIKLEGRITELKYKSSRKETSFIESEVNTCNAELSRLYEYAINHKININIYSSQLARLDGELRIIKYELEERKRKYGNSSSNRWGWIGGVIVKAINFVTSMLGLGSWLKLPGGRNRGELPSGD